jgi:hypothetical protein
MAQEGIATLPQSPENAAPPPVIGLDASKNELLQQFGPEAMSGYEETMSQAASQLNVPLDQLKQLQQIIDYIFKNVQNYPQIRQELLAKGIREEDLPPEFDAGYFGSMQVMLLEAIKRAEGQARGNMDQGPAMQAPEDSPLQVSPQGFAQGGLAGAAESLRQKGRNGDTILAHINPQEAQMLKRMGGSGTINPRTGLPEFGFFDNPLKELGNGWNSVKNVVTPILKSPVGKIIATAALTYALGPSGYALVSAPVATAIAAGSITALGGGDLKSSLISAATGYGMAYLAPNISNMLPGAGDAVSGAAPSFLNAVMTGGVMGTGYGLLTGQNLQNSLKMGATGAVIGGAANYLQSGPYAPKEGAPGAPITDQSQQVSLQPDGSYAPDGSYTPGNAVEAAMPDPYSIGDYANRVTAQGGALTPDQVSATNPAGGNQTPMQDWLNQNNTTYDRSLDLTTNQNIDVGSGTGTGYNTNINSTVSKPIANTPNASTGSKGFMEYVPDFMKSSDGSLSIPMTTAAVLGVGALTGGFKTASPSSTANSEYTGIERDSSGQPVTGSDLLNQNPDKYVYKPNITTAPAVDPYSGNTTNPSDVNMINTRQFGDPRKNPYGTFTPPPMSGGQPTGGAGISLPQPYNTSEMYDFMRQPRRYAEGGISQVYPRRTGGISGPGTGTSDDIPAMLSDGEFVITAKAVRGAGGGSRREGAKKLYRMMHALEKKAK